MIKFLFNKHDLSISIEEIDFKILDVIMKQFNYTYYNDYYDNSFHYRGWYFLCEHHCVTIPQKDLGISSNFKQTFGDDGDYFYFKKICEHFSNFIYKESLKLPQDTIESNSYESTSIDNSDELADIDNSKELHFIDNLKTDFRSKQQIITITTIKEIDRQYNSNIYTSLKSQLHNISINFVEELDKIKGIVKFFNNDVIISYNEDINELIIYNKPNLDEIF